MTASNVKAVFDASAVVAWIFGERGADKIETGMAHAGMSAVNLAELLWKSKQKGYAGDLDELAQSLVEIGLTIIPFEAEHATLVPFVYTAGLRLAEKQPALKGSLSLADCACIATALHLELPIVGDDLLWTTLEIRGLTILKFR